MAPNMHSRLFPVRHFMRPYTLITWKLEVVYGYSISSNCSSIGDVYIWVSAICKIRLASYGSKHALQSLDLSYTTFVYTSHITLKLQVVYFIYECSAYRTTALLSKTFLELFRAAWERQCLNSDQTGLDWQTCELIIWPATGPTHIHYRIYATHSKTVHVFHVHELWNVAVPCSCYKEELMLMM